MPKRPKAAAHKEEQQLVEQQQRQQNGSGGGDNAAELLPVEDLDLSGSSSGDEGEDADVEYSEDSSSEEDGDADSDSLDPDAADEIQDALAEYMEAAAAQQRPADAAGDADGPAGTSGRDHRYVLGVWVLGGLRVCVWGGGGVADVAGVSCVGSIAVENAVSRTARQPAVGGQTLGK